MEELHTWAALVSSELLAVEARCTARRLGDGIALERVEAVLTDQTKLESARWLRGEELGDGNCRRCDSSVA